MKWLDFDTLFFFQNYIILVSFKFSFTFRDYAYIMYAELGRNYLYAKHELFVVSAYISVDSQRTWF